MSDKTLPFIVWNAAAAADATQGRPVGDWHATGVSIDTRTIKSGDLFVAIQGLQSDGHAYAQTALDRGAAAVVVVEGSDAVAADAPTVRVIDTTRALEDLGRAARKRSRAKIAAVTGSVGKTGSKDALAVAFCRQGIVHASEGNLNNHWGLPLTLARMPVEASLAILEMGMNHPGEIRPLTKMARPHVALITTIEQVHSEYFSSIEDIADAKAEIFEGLEAGGAAVLNLDNAMYGRLAGRARDCGVERIVSFGKTDGADVRLLDACLDAGGSCVTADVLGEEIRYRIGVPGRHWVMNTLGVLAVAAAMGLDLGVSSAMMARLNPPRGRGDRTEIKLPDGTFTLIDESYNASPAAMNAAFGVLAMAEPADGGRRIAVLGDMLELGDTAHSLHRQLAVPLEKSGVQKVYAAGPAMACLFEALPDDLQGAHADASDMLTPIVAKVVRPGDVVLVKGSYGSRMTRVVDALKALGQSNGNGE
ncbi:MAG: UDP-N-acetylmuramoylalanyl-D-glutamyl-2,6-diaminopimelate--D-alanyl-D-alanine ligase [Rhodospirillaceae bacterium]